MRFLSLILCFALAACGSSQPTTMVSTAARSEPVTDPIIAAATVLIERTDMKKGHCTGVLVAPDVVATVAHCLEDKSVDRLRIQIDGTPRSPLGIVAQGEVRMARRTQTNGVPVDEAKRDWLLLRIAPVDADPVQVSVPSAAEVRAAAEARGILVPSYSGRRLHLVTPCRLRQQIGSGQVADIFGMACEFRGGASGSPVFLLTDNGPQLIALVMTAENSDGISYAVSTSQFAHLIHP